MTTMQTVVNDALEILGVTQVGQSSNNEDFTFALGVLNDMLHGWRSRGVDIGHETLGATENINLLEEHEGDVKVLLATHSRMVSRFGIPVETNLMNEANSAWSAIYGAYSSPPPAPHDGAFKRMPLQRRRWGQ